MQPDLRQILRWLRKEHIDALYRLSNGLPPRQRPVFNRELWRWGLYEQIGKRPVSYSFYDRCVDVHTTEWRLTDFGRVVLCAYEAVQQAGLL